MPSQRAVDSLSALINFAESVHVCRHVSVCRYFGEQIDTGNPATMESYCDSMCDVCKYPDKTRRRKLELSSEELVMSQKATLRQQAVRDIDNDGHRHVQQPAIKRSNGLIRASDIPDTGGRKDFRQGSNVISNDHGHASRLTSTKSVGASRSATVGSKRPASGVTRHDAVNAKKVKVQHPAPLLGMSSRLKQTINKPFRSPFKSVIQSVSENGAQSVSVEIAADEDEEAAQTFSTSQNTVSVDDAPPPNDDAPIKIEELMSSPLSIPATDFELDASYSQKIPVPMRSETFTSLRRTLHKVFSNATSGDTLWAKLGMSGLEADVRDSVLSHTARELEFTVHSLCSTPDGYQARSQRQLWAVNTLSKAETWGSQPPEDLEDGKEALEVLERVCASSLHRKGKARSML